MSADWVQRPLGEVIALQRGHDLPSQDRNDGAVPIMGSSGLTGYHDQPKAPGPGVVVGRSGNSMGEVSFCPVDYWPLNTALYVTDFKGNDERFIYYLLKTINFDQFNSGSAQKSLNRNAVYPYEVSLPNSVEEQKRISAVLADLETKLELNTQINQTLEQMAQAIFKSWFVDFEPVKAKIAALEAGGTATDAELAAMQAISGKDLDQLAQMAAEQREQYATLQATAALFPAAMQASELGEIPEGWNTLSLDSVAKYQNGLALQKFRPEDENDFLPVVKIAQLKKGYADGEEKASPNIKPECIIDDGDVVFSWSGSLMVDVWCGGKAALNQHLFKVTSKQYPKWLYYYFTKHHLEEFQRIAAAKAVTMGHIKREHLKQALCAVPDTQLIAACSAILGDMVTKQVEIRLESKSLSQIRDALLPKLLSGELTLPETEPQLQDVANV